MQRLRKVMEPLRMYGFGQMAVIELPGLHGRQRPVPRYCWHRRSRRSAELFRLSPMTATHGA